MVQTFPTIYPQTFTTDAGGLGLSCRVQVPNRPIHRRNVFTPKTPCRQWNRQAAVTAPISVGAAEIIENSSTEEFEAPIHQADLAFYVAGLPEVTISFSVNLRWDRSI
ncbi:MAG: hypothetical protein NTW32_17085 [Chloroflexi bacterium]|nr:hypothetical protein [Chloroflexota bacterium]